MNPGFTEEEGYRIDRRHRPVACMAVHHFCGALSWRRLNSIKGAEVGRVTGQWRIARNLSGGTLEARRAELRGRRPRSGRGSWRGGSEPPPYQLGSPGERCKLPQRV